MADTNYDMIDRYFDQVVKGMPNDQLDTLAREPAGFSDPNSVLKPLGGSMPTQQPNDILQALKFDPNKKEGAQDPLQLDPAADEINAELKKMHEKSGEPSPTVIEGNPVQPFQIEAEGYPNKKLNYLPAENARQNYNSAIIDMQRIQKDRKADVDEGRAAIKEKEGVAKRALQNLQDSLTPYTPSMDYNAEILKLRDQNDAIKDPQPDMLSKMILSLGPALLGGLSGEAGAMVAPKVEAESQAAYDKELNTLRAHNVMLRKNISDRITSLSKMQKNDVSKYTETEKLLLDKAKAVSQESNTAARYDKEDLVQRNQALNEITRQIGDTFGKGNAEVHGLEQKNDASNNAVKAQQIRSNSPLAEARLQESKERAVTTDWNRASKDNVQRIEAGSRVLGMVNSIRSGALVDSASIRNTLTNDLSVLAMPSGSAGSLSDREKTAIHNIYTIQKEALSFLDSNPNSTIPPKYLDQIESEAKVLQDKNGAALKGRFNAMLGGTADSFKKNLYKGRYDAITQEHNIDPESGHYRSPISSDSSTSTGAQQTKVIGGVTYQKVQGGWQRVK